MKNPTTSSWNFGISRNDVEKLLRGFKPAAMEDRWMCRADAPKARGDFVVHVHRSWTGDEVLRMNVALAVPDGDKAWALTDEYQATITDLTWDRGEGSFLATELEAKDLATAQTIYCCTSNEMEQVVPEIDETEVCCQSSGGSMRDLFLFSHVYFLVIIFTSTAAILACTTILVTLPSFVLARTFKVVLVGMPVYQLQSISTMSS
ncbi:hypothetical protein INS49_004364 [Diaporthe citri]|uniref:uncharacterized protein n=1 Tax=Diaporthe citri TaxID=83186 RepID=UPI001C80C5D6|nr:uncharacterized protein INS49_004364 [Diaporthe citri]KAG6354347.1 hypothetical protein INS49_004364 [Diaporthe citri]